MLIRGEGLAQGYSVQHRIVPQESVMAVGRMIVAEGKTEELGEKTLSRFQCTRFQHVVLDLYCFSLWLEVTITQPLLW